MTFDWTVPVEAQLTDYSCSVGATFWCLRSLGVNVSQSDLQELMVPTLVSPDLGLLDGSGTGIARLLTDRYGLAATSKQPVTFDEVVARARQQPIAIGGARWFVDDDGHATGHWVGVRSFDGSRLLLANPGGTGPHFGQSALDRSDFEQRAPFAAVWIDALAATAPQFRVVNTGGRGANVRTDPSLTAAVVRTLADGVAVSGEPYAWRQVVLEDGTRGWIAEDFLAPQA